MSEPIVEVTGDTLMIEIGGQFIYLTREQAKSLKEQLSENIWMRMRRDVRRMTFQDLAKVSDEMLAAEMVSRGYSVKRTLPRRTGQTL